MASRSAAKVGGLQAVLKRLVRPKYKVPAKDEEVNALERLLALILQDEDAYKHGEAAVRALKRRFANWNEVRVARGFEVKDALQKSRVPRAEERAGLAQEFLRRVFGLQNHLELDWLYDATSERRQKLLVAITMATPMVAPALDLDAAETESPIIDTNLKRLLSRLGLVPSNPKDAQVRELVEEELSGSSRYPNTIALEIHAREVCDSKHPHCRQCLLLDMCPHGKRVLGPAATRAALQDMGKSAKKSTRSKKASSSKAAKASKKSKTAKKKTTTRKTTKKKSKAASVTNKQRKTAARSR